MKGYFLSPEAGADLEEIKSYLLQETSLPVTRYVVRELRLGMQFLSSTPEAGHHREDLTDDAVLFWPVFSYLIVYNAATVPIEIARVLHANRDVATILRSDK